MYLRLKVIGKKNKNAKNKKMEKTLKENERFHLLIDDPILKNHITRQLEKIAIFNISFKNLSHVTRQLSTIHHYLDTWPTNMKLAFLFFYQQETTFL